MSVRAIERVDTAAPVSRGSQATTRDVARSIGCDEHDACLGGPCKRSEAIEGGVIGPGVMASSASARNRANSSLARRRSPTRWRW